MRAPVRYTHGQPGSRIPGSRYWRAYCKYCGEPIRSDQPELASLGQCECDECRALCRNERGRLRAERRAT